MSSDHRSSSRENCDDQPHVTLSGPSNYLAWRRDRESHALYKGYHPMLLRPPYQYTGPPMVNEDLATDDDDDEITEITQRLRNSAMFTDNTPVKQRPRPPAVSRESTADHEAANDAITKAREKKQRLYDLCNKEQTLNGTAIYFLNRSLSQQVGANTRHFKTAHEMWEYLYVTYGQATRAAISSLLHQFLNKRFNAPTVMKVCAWIADITTQLRDAGRDISEQEKIEQALTLLEAHQHPSMVSTVETIRTQMELGLTDSKFPNLAALQTYLSTVEIRISLNKTRQASTREQKPSTRDNWALVHTTGPTRGGRQQTSSRGGKASNKHAAGRDNNTGGARFCAKCKKDHGPNNKCYGKFPKGVKALAARAYDDDEEDDDVCSFMAHIPAPLSVDSPVWLHDSGSSYHLSGNEEDFTNLRALPRPIRIKGIQDSKVVATKAGAIQVKVWHNNKAILSMQLDNVLFVPRLGVRLFSANAAAKTGLLSLIRASHIDILNANDETSVLFEYPESPTYKGLYVCPFTSADANTYDACYSLCSAIPLGSIIESQVLSVTVPASTTSPSSRSTSTHRVAPPVVCNEAGPTGTPGQADATGLDTSSDTSEFESTLPESAPLSPTAPIFRGIFSGHQDDTQTPEDTLAPEEATTASEEDSCTSEEDVDPIQAPSCPAPFTANHAWDRYPKPKATHEVWHARLGHVSKDRLNKLASKAMVTGMELTGTPPTAM